MKLASALVLLTCSPEVAALVPPTAASSRRAAISGPSSTTSLSMSATGNRNATPHHRGDEQCGRRAALGNLAGGLFGAVVVGGDARPASAFVEDADTATAPVEEAEPLIARLSDTIASAVNPLLVAAALAAVAVGGASSSNPNASSARKRKPSGYSKGNASWKGKQLGGTGTGGYTVANEPIAFSHATTSAKREGAKREAVATAVEPTEAAAEAKVGQPGKPAALEAPAEEPSPEVIEAAQEVLDSSLEAIAVAQEMLDSTRSAATSAAITASSSIPGPSDGPTKAGGWSKSSASWKTPSSRSGMSSYLDGVADGVASEMMSGSRRAASAEAAAPSPAAPASSAEETSPGAITAAQEMLDSTRSAATSAAMTASSSIPGPSDGPTKAGGWSKSSASWKTSPSSGSGMSSYLESVADGVASEMMSGSRRKAAAPSPVEPASSAEETSPGVITAAQEMLDSSRSAATSAATTASSSIPPMKVGGWSKSSASWKTSSSSGSGMSSYLESVADGVASEMMNASRRAASAEAAALSAEAAAPSSEPAGNGFPEPDLAANGAPVKGSGPKKSYAKSTASWKTADDSGGAAVGGSGAAEGSYVQTETERLSDEVKRIVEELEGNTPPSLPPPTEMVVESASPPVRAMSVTIGGRVITTTPGFASMSRSSASATVAVQPSSVATAESASPPSTKKKGWGKSGASWKNNPMPTDGSGGYLDNLKP